MSLHVDPTVLDDPDTEVVWKPTPKQAEFLASDDFEVLYGGAAGGGKSDALLIDALCLQHGGLENGNHRAVLFRRSFVELRDLIGRSLELYRDIDPEDIPDDLDRQRLINLGNEQYGRRRGRG